VNANKKLIGILITLSMFIINGCDKDDAPVDLSKITHIQKLIEVATGGTLTIADSIQLKIPSNAFSANGEVYFGFSDVETATIPNPNLESVGESLTIRFPSVDLLEPVQLIIPFVKSGIDTTNYYLFLYNGASFFPIEYELNGPLMIASIDNINWEVLTNKKNTHLVSEIIIIGLRVKQTIPSKQMGIRKVPVDMVSGEMIFEDPSAGTNSKILLMIHGWVGNPEKWDYFMKKFQESDELNYTEIWTFGYNSGLSIEANGQTLNLELETYLKNSKVDILAHSMGGLVSRSMIEQHDGAGFVNKLISLGTPHEGSPLAVTRYVLGDIVASEEPQYSGSYTTASRGFRDLNADSDFIKEMKDLSQPPLPYYT
jgi:hypothetical protein